MRIIGKKKAAYSIGIIKSSEERNKIWEEKKERCRKNAILRENKVLGIELKKYLIDKYGAIVMDFPKRKKQMFKANVLCNMHPEALPESCFPPKGGGKRALKKWLNQNYPEPMVLAQNIPDEKYCLEFAYLVIQEKDIEIFLELSTGCMQMNSKGYDMEDMSRDIILWKGITQEDVDNETPEFMAYANAFSSNIEKIGAKK